MGLYATCILPRLIDLVMRDRVARAERARLLPAARGRALEAGMGSGLNLPFYSTAVEVVYGVDPSPQLLAMARRRAAAVRFPVVLVRASAERLPVADRSVDTVVVTWSLCSIPEPVAALREMWRVLKPGGELLFVEHGRAPDPGVRACQDWLTPAWKRLAGGCHLNRQMDELIEAGGFRITRLEREYGQGCRLFSYRYRGSAVPAGACH